MWGFCETERKIHPKWNCTLSDARLECFYKKVLLEQSPSKIKTESKQLLGIPSVNIKNHWSFKRRPIDNRNPKFFPSDSFD